MSTLSEQVRVALFEKLNVAGVTDLATGGVHFMIAPEQDASGNLVTNPLVIFSRVPTRIDYALAGNIVGEQDLWLVKVVVDKDSSTTMSPAALAEAILAACDTAIGGILTLSTATNRVARRTVDMPAFQETLTDRINYYFGFYLTVYSG